jgi:hypothetical protein
MKVAHSEIFGMFQSSVAMKQNINNICRIPATFNSFWGKKKKKKALGEVEHF